MVFKRAIELLASPRWLFWLLPWFMVLLVLGTVAQRYIGLIDAQALFFSSWILWLVVIPMPGGITTLAIITLSLMAKLLCYSPWSREKIGTIISHLSILMLMLGGALTWLCNAEGFVTLAEGESTSAMQDYYTRNFTLYEDGKPIAIFPEETLKNPSTLLLPSPLPFSIKVESFCDNCQTYLQENPQNQRGIAQKLLLDSATLKKEKEDNKAGLTFTLSGANKKADGGYIAYELLPSQAPEWVADGKHYRATLARAESALPFSIKLLDFEKINYPNSDQAQEYLSLVEITDGKTRLQQTIAMNEPLRHRGYTLYQSSFLRIGDQESSVLSVVKNDGWLAPYFATFLLAVGLIWQCVSYYRRRQH